MRVQPPKVASLTVIDALLAFAFLLFLLYAFPARAEVTKMLIVNPANPEDVRQFHDWVHEILHDRFKSAGGMVNFKKTLMEGGLIKFEWDNYGDASEARGGTVIGEI